MILEQVVVAGFDTYNIDVVDACLKELSTMFDIDSSQRMRRLRATKFEMLERYDDALDILDTILPKKKKNPWTSRRTKVRGKEAWEEAWKKTWKKARESKGKIINQLPLIRRLKVNQ